MGFQKVAYLYCDGNFAGCETIQEYKKAMKKAGWLFKKGNKAYCPACRKKL